MEKFLAKIGLFDKLNIGIPIQREKFVEILKSNVDQDQPYYSEIFSSNKNIYKGTVTSNNFEFRRKRKLFDMKMNSTKCSGKFNQVNDKLEIEIAFDGFPRILILFFGMLILFYLAALIFILIGGTSAFMLAMILPILAFHALFMLGIPYMMLKRSLQTTKYDLQRDLHFMLKDQPE